MVHTPEVCFFCSKISFRNNLVEQCTVLAEDIRPPCFGHKYPFFLAVSGAQLANAIRDCVVTCKDVSQDADVSRPIRNLHDFTNGCDGRASSRLPPLQIPPKVSSCPSPLQLLSRGMPNVVRQRPSVDTPPLTVLGLRVVQKVQFTAPLMTGLTAVSSRSK